MARAQRDSAERADARERACAPFRTDMLQERFETQSNHEAARERVAGGRPSGRKPLGFITRLNVAHMAFVFQT